MRQRWGNLNDFLAMRAGNIADSRRVKRNIALAERALALDHEAFFHWLVPNSRISRPYYTQTAQEIKHL
jgi:hypothetical protein